MKTCQDEARLSRCSECKQGRKDGIFVLSAFAVVESPDG